jgi:hypothetical protein
MYSKNEDKQDKVKVENNGKRQLNPFEMKNKLNQIKNLFSN